MKQRGTSDMNDYIEDYEQAMNDYNNMGPLWAEMVFGDDFEAMKALYGNNAKGNRNNNTNHEEYGYDRKKSRR
ncbi:MAG TPA: hypothetical protein VH186_03315 [Chloroflexia bacterium]|nr:hypothetical protein [Chloroflexia bacterium]